MATDLETERLPPSAEAAWLASQPVFGAPGGSASAGNRTIAITTRAPEEAAVDSNTAQEAESVNHPAHYGGDTTYEAIKVIEAWNLDFCLGNTVKYIARAGKKVPTFDAKLDDLRKARWYLDREITNMEKELEN